MVAAVNSPKFASQVGAYHSSDIAVATKTEGTKKSERETIAKTKTVRQ